MNRRFGRKKGTEILTGYGTAVSRMIEKDEMIGHMGGDSFVALILRSRVKQFINSLEDIAVTVEVDGKNETVHFSAAIGAWDVNRDDIDLEELIRRPYMGMNMARKDHVSCFYVTEKMLSQMAEIKTVLEHYNEALETGEFKVFYQPKVDSKTGRLAGAEGLVRWFRGDRIISPGVFIPALEDNREIIKLDYYVLRQACLDIRSWTEKGYDVVPVSVNFSRRDLEDRDLAVNINKIIEETGIDKKYIEIELTETVDADEHGELSKFIDRLYKMGIMTAIDDFGAGYSSLATLREFSVHTLKLDRSFVNTDDFSWKDEIILRDVIHMAGELNMDILCEGVERDDQLALLNSVGCFVIQGYYYDRPLPEEEFEERLKKKVYTGV
jgi:EAL domain-containing protein (putative c-di-GMP-specific phosphodiesterase class I)